MRGDYGSFLSIVDPEAVRNAARDVLSNPEFQVPRRHWWDRVLYYAAHPDELVGMALQWLIDQYFAGSLRQSVLAWGLTVAFAAMCAFLIMRFTSTSSPEHVVPLSDGISGSSGQSLEELLAQAAVHESEGDWRLAMRARYAALLAQLASIGVIRRRPGRTTGEYLYEVSTNSPTAGPAFGDATRLFEWAWYGSRPIASRDVAEFVRLAADTCSLAKKS